MIYYKHMLKHINFNLTFYFARRSKVSGTSNTGGSNAKI